MERKMNTKAFILTLDIILGMAIVFTVIFITLFFVSRGAETTIAQHQLARIGSDIVAIMDRQKVFDSLDYETIETELEALTPENAGMLIRIEGDFSTGNGTIEAGGEIPAENIIISGKRVALTEEDIFLKITYFMWPRQQ